MAKSRYFRVAGKAFDADGLERLVTEEAKNAMEAQMDAQVEQIVDQLGDLLVDLNERSSNRGRGFYAVRYNEPFGDAQIIVNKRRNANGDLSYTIRVNNDKFNILDQGRPAFSSEKPMKFPRYSGRLTWQNSDKVSPSPVKILDQRTVNDPDNLEQAIIGEGWATVNEVAEIKPRNFILNIAKRVRSQLAGAPSGVRAGLVKISVRKS